MDARDLRSEVGETLVETLAALVILSIAAVAILAGIQLSTKASDMHRKQTTGGAYVRSYAEAIEKYLDTTGNYVRCAGATEYSAAKVGFAKPSGYDVEQDAAIPLGGGGASSGTCPGKDTGAQKVTLRLRSTDGRATEQLTVVLRRSCSRSQPCADY